MFIIADLVILMSINASVINGHYKCKKNSMVNVHKFELITIKGDGNPDDYYVLYERS